MGNEDGKYMDDKRGIGKSGVGLASLGFKYLMSVWIPTWSEVMSTVLWLENWPAFKLLLGPHVSGLFPISQLVSLVLVLKSTITAAHNVTSSLLISPLHDPVFTPRIAYAECCTYWVLHTPRTAVTKYTIISWSTVFRFQPVCHLSSLISQLLENHDVLNSLPSEDGKQTNA